MFPTLHEMIDINQCTTDDVLLIRLGRTDQKNLQRHALHGVLGEGRQLACAISSHQI
jgi:hypothetical protein